MIAGWLVYGLVYLLTNRVNGKCYIGQTKRSLERRFSQHASSNYKIPICLALKKYGKDNFSKEVIFLAFTKESLDIAEITLIEEFKTASPSGYNLKEGGYHGSHGPETRKKISESRIGKSPSAETRAKLSAINSGKKLSAETKEKVINKLRGRVISQATKDKIAARFKGQQRPKEVVEKIATSLRGRKLSPERCLAISTLQRGKKRSPQACENIRLGWIKRKATTHQEAIL